MLKYVSVGWETEIWFSLICLLYNIYHNCKLRLVFINIPLKIRFLQINLKWKSEIALQFVGWKDCNIISVERSSQYVTGYLFNFSATNGAYRIDIELLFRASVASKLVGYLLMNKTSILRSLITNIAERSIICWYLQRWLMINGGRKYFTASFAWIFCFAFFIYKRGTVT